MSVITFNSGIKLSVEPLFSQSPGIFVSWRSEEFLGGKLPIITITMKSQKDLCKVLDEMECKFTNQDGWSFKFKAYVYQTQFLNLNYIVKLFSCDKNFLRQVNTETYQGAKKAIQSTYKFDIDKNAESDLINSIKLYQKNENNFHFLTRIMNSYKFNTVWGYGLGRLMIRDLNSWKEEYLFERLANLTPTNPQVLNDPKLYDKEVEILEEYTNHIKVKFDKNIVDVNKEYKDLISNAIFNTKLLTSKSDFQFYTRWMPPIHLATNVTIKSSETKVNQTYITSRIIEIDYNTTKCTFTAKSINP